MNLDAKILAVIDELDALRQSRDDHWQIPRAEGEVLYQLALVSGAKRIVEVGTSYGFSGLFWAAALQQTGGTLHTIDIAQKKFDASREAFERAGVGRSVVNHLGDAAEVLKTMEGPTDIAFLDGSDKSASRVYFDLVWPKVRRGGSVLTDNTRTHPGELNEYVRYVRALPGATSADLPVGNGLEWTVKR